MLSVTSLNVAAFRLNDTDLQDSPSWNERQLIKRLQAALTDHKPALDYVRSRGWTNDTLHHEQLGYMQADKSMLLKDLKLPDRWVRVVRAFPVGMLVYIHTCRGRLTYISGRSIEGKKHYNPPRNLIGERQPYVNHCYHSTADEVVLVEGQADAITFGQWDIPAIAIAGMHINDELLEQLLLHRRVFVALDNTDDARKKSIEIAKSIGPTACIPTYPAAVKDANEWLVKQHATVTQVRTVLNDAQTLVEYEAGCVANMFGLERQDAIENLIERAATWERREVAKLKLLMKEKLGVNTSLFNDTLKAAQENADKQSESEQPQVLADDVPLISPALGFTDDVAFVTVSIMERTAKNRLNVQPYLITSERELKRLGDEQILQLNVREVALKVIPEGTEFLMRWKYRDIQRFLENEPITPADIYNQVHGMFTRHIDFATPEDAHVIALWVIGTYFYTMFSAYPYIALNGPKNSGKSTVLSIAKPLAFNMITTSDITGPSLFRLIHRNSCSVGIDEAERFHSTRDSEMQQIRQLLNSGYKPGMPAIRLIGEDMKPKAFNVYSPKMLANIMGLEDVLASRCIRVPMRRADKQMPALPPTYDGAELRYQLYSLALTHFRAIQHNYTQRPDLCSLQNRSRELWLPLFALAAFFEEQAEISGLLEAVQFATERDALDDGKSLSEREEAVLQALEILTRSSTDIIWLKRSDLHEQVRLILDISEETFGSAPWIKHTLKRLQLIDTARRKNSAHGQTLGIKRSQVLDLMRRYAVDVSQ